MLGQGDHFKDETEKRKLSKNNKNKKTYICVKILAPGRFCPGKK
jgi:hypothetical protein